jgi:predicted AAA+ superfamily ATPase
LAASNLLVLLEPWFSNRTRSITKSPKLYLADTGVLISLLNIRDMDDLLRSPLLGSIWETYVFSELRRRQTARDGSWSIHFFRDRSVEVDFLVHRGGRFDLFEAKWTEHPARRDLEGFAGASKNLGEESIASRTVVCRTPHPFPLEDGAWACGVGDL